MLDIFFDALHGHLDCSTLHAGLQLGAATLHWFALVFTNDVLHGTAKPSIGMLLTALMQRELRVLIRHACSGRPRNRMVPKLQPLLLLCMLQAPWGPEKAQASAGAWNLCTCLNR